MPVIQLALQRSFRRRRQLLKVAMAYWPMHQIPAWLL
jgi:hypothetical protein